MVALEGWFPPQVIENTLMTLWPHSIGTLLSREKGTFPAENEIGVTG
ncbi:hypothetical protein L4X63_00470 [Geomonas sp. Red32]|nr:hypothetical protein [Geomonas sp. Red32]MCM0080056.1 hypothetical protein [Geomonas sp. Red32]